VTTSLTWAQASHPAPVLVRGAWARALDPPRGILLGAGRDRYDLSSVDTDDDTCLVALAVR